jgi:hypothetical protein
MARRKRKSRKKYVVGDFFSTTAELDRKIANHPWKPGRVWRVIGNTLVIKQGKKVLYTMRPKRNG